MSVYNGGTALAATLDSVLAQEGVAFEFIVVDDGSTDGSGALLDDHARRDERLRVIHQDNRGLTRALIRGCAAAKGPFIARQDAGDISLPGRLARQSAFLESNPEVVLTACGTRFVGPAGELLYEQVQHGDELQRGLEQLDSKRIRGPSHHGSVMFRQAAYHAVGGYRPEFRVAQDLDLWMRLAEVGGCVAVPEVLYQAWLTRGAISHNRRDEQLRMTAIILQSAALRRLGWEDSSVMSHHIQRGCLAIKALFPVPQSLQDARFYYFIGSLLRQRKPAKAKYYYQQALNSWWFYPKAIFRLWTLRGQP